MVLQERLLAGNEATCAHRPCPCRPVCNLGLSRNKPRTWSDSFTLKFLLSLSLISTTCSSFSVSSGFLVKQRQDLTSHKCEPETDPHKHRIPGPAWPHQTPGAPLFCRGGRVHTALGRVCVTWLNSRWVTIRHLCETGGQSWGL